MHKYEQVLKVNPSIQEKYAYSVIAQHVHVGLEF